MVPAYWTIPPLWSGETVVCVGGGPSLTPEDVALCRGRARVIVINNAYQLAPWADLLFAVGLYSGLPSWWTHYPDAVTFPGLKVTMDPDIVHTHPEIKLVRRAPGNEGAIGLSLDPTMLCHGYNGGYSAINLAVLLGAARILLLGYDMQHDAGRHHWHPDHPKWQPPPFTDWLLAFDTLVAPLAAVGVTVRNCSRATALRAFPCGPLLEALPCPI